MHDFNREEGVDSRDKGELHVERDPEIPTGPLSVPRGSSLPRSPRSQIGHFGAMECKGLRLRAARPLACLPAGRSVARGSRHGQGGAAYNCDRYLARSLPLHLLIYLHLSLSCCRAAIMMGGGLEECCTWIIHPLRHARPFTMPAPCGPL